MQWTSPDGQTYTTYPGSRLLFPTLCRPTAPLTVTPPASGTTDAAARTLAMPRRTTTRAQNRTQAINDERRHNQTLIHTEAHERNQQRQADAGNNCDDNYFPTRPPPPSDHDPAPF